MSVRTAVHPAVRGGDDVRIANFHQDPFPAALRAHGPPARTHTRMRARMCFGAARHNATRRGAWRASTPHTLAHTQPARMWWRPTHPSGLRRFLHRQFRHVWRHVCRRAHRRVYRHVYRHVYRTLNERLLDPYIPMPSRAESRARLGSARLGSARLGLPRVNTHVDKATKMCTGHSTKGC